MRQKRERTRGTEEDKAPLIEPKSLYNVAIPKSEFLKPTSRIGQLEADPPEFLKPKERCLIQI